MKQILLLLLVLFSSSAWALESQMVSFGESCRIRVVSKTPKSVTPKADVLFLIGFADRADNHGPLFEQLAGQGYRVISFDYPDHGESRCYSLDMQNFTTLSTISERILERQEYSSDRPLYLSGWSTGGLLAYRMAQQGAFAERQVAGMVLLAPGLSVYMIPGEAGWVTQESLLSNPNPPHLGPIQPESPLVYPAFSSALLFNAWRARRQSVPNIPILMFLGGDRQDVYANTPKIKSWYEEVRTSNPDFVAYQCSGAKHELDNEIEPIGGTVQRLFVDFIGGTQSLVSSGNPCQLL